MSLNLCSLFTPLFKFQPGRDSYAYSLFTYFNFIVVASLRHKFIQTTPIFNNFRSHGNIRL